MAVAPCCIIRHYRESSFPLHSYSSSIFVTTFQAAVGCSFLPSVVFHSSLGQGDSLIILKTLGITHPSRSYSNDIRYIHITFPRPGASSDQQRMTQNLAGMQNKTQIIHSIQLFIHSYQDSWRDLLTFGPKPNSQTLKFVDFTSQ